MAKMDSPSLFDLLKYAQLDPPESIKGIGPRFPTDAELQWAVSLPKRERAKLNAILKHESLRAACKAWEGYQSDLAKLRGQ